MKTILTILFSGIYLFCGARPVTTLQKLTEVNHCWTEQGIITGLPAFDKDLDETGWIRLHLQLVAERLRDKGNMGLTREQTARRAVCLANLHSYWQAGRFPVNDLKPYRTPIFIDHNNTFCAVGYLMKTSGAEGLARQISADNNLAYLRGIKTPGVAEWAELNGFTPDELAWIQPAYGQRGKIFPMGKGINGAVSELIADTADNCLYVGGTFSHADSSIPANNIARVTEYASGVWHWQALDSGLNGPVYALIKRNGLLFAGGHFSASGNTPLSNVAVWNGQKWAAMGCLDGTVRDLAIMNGTLVACGSFGDCTHGVAANVAYWNGFSWQAMPGIDGTVNAMYALDTTLILGGNFNNRKDALNIIKWSRGSGFSAFGNVLSYEVMGFEYFRNTLIAVSKNTSGDNVTTLIDTLANNRWNNVLLGSWLGPFNSTPNFGFNTICAAESDFTLWTGGSFECGFRIGCDAYNVAEFAPRGGLWGCNAFYVDGPVNKMVMFDHQLITAGAFKKDRGGNPLNGIGATPFPAVAVSQVASSKPVLFYPNPATSESTLTIEGQEQVSAYAISDCIGKQHAAGRMEAGSNQLIHLPKLLPGVYQVVLSTQSGTRLAKLLTIQ